jgi:DNA-binding MurR/RpiR family transcriptional regulator
MSKNNHTKAIREYNREISTTKIDAIIDRTIERIDNNIDRLMDDMSLAQVIEVVHMLQDMRERERNEPTKACKSVCNKKSP